METLETKEQFLGCDGCAKQEPSMIRKQSEDWRNMFFGSWWAWQSIAKLKTFVIVFLTNKSYFQKSNRGVGSKIVYSRDHKTTTPNVSANILAHFAEKVNAFVHWKLQPSTFHPLSLFSQRFYTSGGFPSPNPSSEATAVFVLRIHGSLGLKEPLEDRNVALQGCQMQWCRASGAAAHGPSPQREPNESEREQKLWEIFGTSKVEVVEIAATENPIKEQ